MQPRCGRPVDQWLINRRTRLIKVVLAIGVHAFQFRMIDLTHLSRMLSLVVAICFVVVVFVITASGESAFRAALAVLLPLFCIWHSEAMGRLTGISMGIGRPMITEETLGVFVAAGGCIFTDCRNLHLDVDAIAILELCQNHGLQRSGRAARFGCTTPFEREHRT